MPSIYGRRVLTLYLLTGCGGTYTAAVGSIFSPGYPNNYQHNLTCDYFIVADPTQYIVMQFDDSNFRIEGTLSMCEQKSN